MTENNEQSYSRVIYQNKDDKNAQQLVNSYKYGYNNKKKQPWSPNIQEEERFRKKREREDAYLENFHPMDRPVLVIKQKTKFETTNPDVFLDSKNKEQYFKVSQNTNLVDNIGEEIKFLEGMIRRQTTVQNKA